MPAPAGQLQLGGLGEPAEVVHAEHGLGDPLLSVEMPPGRAALRVRQGPVRFARPVSPHPVAPLAPPAALGLLAGAGPATPLVSAAARLDHVAPADVGQDRGVGTADDVKLPDPEHGEAAPLAQQPLEPMEERARVALLGLDVHRLVAVDGVHERRKVELRKVATRKAGVAVGGPLHRRADRVSVAEVDVVAHEELVAVVDDRASGHRQQEGVEELGQAPVAVEQRRQATPDPHVTLHAGVLGVLGEEIVALLVAHLLERELVVVAQEDGPLAPVGHVGGLRQDLGDRVPLFLAHRGEQPGHEREVEAQVALVAVAEVVRHVRWPPVGLGQQNPARVPGVHLLANALDKGVGLGQVLSRRAVPLEQIGHGVEPESVKPEVQPEAHHLEHGLAHLGVFVVEIRLVGVEAMPVVLLAGVVPRPVGPLDVVEHDTGLGPTLIVVVPDVPIGPGVVLARSRLDEPGVLIARVVHHQVPDDPDASPVRVLEEPDEVTQRPVARVHVEEVADVVPAVTKGRGIEGQEPQAVDPQPLEVVELLPQAGEIARTVVVGVVEALEVHLVEDRPAVPVDRRVEGSAVRGEGGLGHQRFKSSRRSSSSSAAS